jgi:hypothetical protein
MKLDQKLLKQLLDYNPESGIFRWASRPNRSIRIGDIAGGDNGHGYWTIGIDGKYYMAHQLAWMWVNGAFPVNGIDHINRNPLDNRIENLRDVPHAINKQNMVRAQSNSKTGKLGVRFHLGAYEANIIVGRKQKYLGRFDSITQAENAYLKAKSELHPLGVIDHG